MKISIQNGIIQGIHEHGCLAFKGIPYAKPPVKDLRFLPPQPCEDWHGVLDCSRYGPRPIQFPPDYCLDKDSAVYSEDCLNLNVWTPSVNGKKRPVLFNIFGGGHMSGSNSELGSEGYRLVRDNDIVFVSPNYRVGALGFLYLGHLLGKSYESTGNLGLLDLILALKWVRNNISHFGGDPNQVTIVGQSAGGKLVMDLMLAPAAKGLFHRAVAMSGALQSIKDIQTEQRLTKNFLNAMGLTEETAKELLTCTPEAIVKGQEEANKVYFKAESYGATADGITLPLDIEATIDKGHFNSVPLIMGHTLQELGPDPNAKPEQIDIKEIKRRLIWKFGDNWRVPFRAYKEELISHSSDFAYGTIATRFTYVEAYLRTAAYLAKQNQKLWLYRWDYAGGLTACHSSDNEALFDRTDPEKHRLEPEKTSKVGHCFRQAVIQFVKTGDPNVEHIPQWHSFSETTPMRIIFDYPIRTETFHPRYTENFPLQVFKLE